MPTARKDTGPKKYFQLLNNTGSHNLGGGQFVYHQDKGPDSVIECVENLCVKFPNKFRELQKHEVDFIRSDKSQQSVAETQVQTSNTEVEQEFSDAD